MSFYPDTCRPFNCYAATEEEEDNERAGHLKREAGKVVKDDVGFLVLSASLVGLM